MDEEEVDGGSEGAGCVVDGIEGSLFRSTA